MGKCIDIPEVATETIVLAFDLIGFEVGNTNDVGRALRKEQVQKAIQDALKKENKKLTKQFLKGKPISNDKAKESFLNLSKATGFALLEPAQKKLKLQLGCAWNRSPLGIWVDENQWVLYIVVPLIIGGAGAGAAYMYHARVGDTPAGILTSLVEPHLKFKPLGNLTLGASDIKFVPSERTVETRVFSNIEWKPINVGFSVFGGVKEGSLANLRLQSDIKYKGSGSTNNLSFGFNTFVEHDAEDGFSYGGGANAGIDARLFGSPVRFGVEGAWKERFDFQAGRQTEGTLMFTLGKTL